MSFSDSDPTFDLIFLFGPPLFSKSSYLPKSFFRKDFIQIIPSKLFEDNPAFGLRDVSLKIVSELKKDKQVFVDDELNSRSTRRSILSTVKKKVPGSRILLVKIIPVHGLFQVSWTHQNAHGSGLLQKCSYQAKYINSTQWFDSSLSSIDYKSGYVDAPDETEGFEVKELNARFQIQSNFIFEVPALFIQWEAAVSDSGDVNMTLCDICCKWSASNSRGRIIVIHSGDKDSKLEKREKNVINQNLKQFAMKVHHPLYVVKIEKSSSVNSFCLPPQPGVLAFLQAQHLIDLQAKHTLYIFETSDHMKMAQAAGIKHIKSNKAFKCQEKILSNLCVNPPVPTMLKDMIFVKGNEGETANVPLLDKFGDSTEGFRSHLYQDGLEVQVFFPNAADCFKVQESFTSLITSIDMPGSKIPPELNSISYTNKTKRKLDEKKSTLLQTNQNLPVWMKQRLKRKSTESSLSSLDSDEQESSFKFTKTIYVMSEKELKEMAVQVINQVKVSKQILLNTNEFSTYVMVVICGNDRSLTTLQILLPADSLVEVEK